MNYRQMCVYKLSFSNWRNILSLAVALTIGFCFAPRAFAQQQDSGTTASQSLVSSSKSSSSSSADVTVPPLGVTIGNYNVQGSIDAGWRYNNITGSEANYDTFLNLHQGPRLLGLSLNMRSLNHHGKFFDTFSLTGLGFGGDPVDVLRLNVSKDKWYNFDAAYRRYKYFWGYNLLANPLNPSSSNPSVPITMAPHLMDLSHRMSDFDLTLLPQSSVRFRLGYSHALEEGPMYSTTGATVGAEEEPGATAQLFQDYRTSNDLYHAGVDFSVLPRTTFSYDQFVQHYKEDNQWIDSNLGYQLSNGTPVDLGLVFNTVGNTPCAVPGVDGGTTPPTANPSCQGNLFYDRGGNPRGTTPTERFGFQSTYIRNLTTTGHISYSSGDQTVNDIYDSWAGLNTRLHGAGSNSTAYTRATRVVVNGEWNAVYQITPKFRVMDNFDYRAYRTPSIDNFGAMNFFAQLAPGGGYSMLLPPGQFNSTNCPPPYTASTCPQHTSSDGPDLAAGYNRTYLGQSFDANIFKLAYDFTPKVGANIGYRYSNRQITDFSAVYYTGETYFPGGPSGQSAAYRGDCSRVGVQLPAGCTQQPDGSVVFVGLAADSDTSHNLAADINGHAALFGFWVRPTGNFRTSFNLELFSADHSFARITPRQVRHYQINSVYNPVRWAEITGAVDIVDSSNNVTEVQNQDHNRSYSISTMFTPVSRFSFDLSYNYNDVYTQALVCYAVSGPAAQNVAPCPIAGSPVPDAAITTYSSKTNFASADMMIQPAKQLTFTLGYAGSFVRGTPSWFNPLGSYSVAFLDPLTPYGPLRFNYQTPYVSMNWVVRHGLSYSTTWNYYGYNTRGNNNPTGLAPLGTQDFNGNNMTMEIKYAF